MEVRGWREEPEVEVKVEAEAKAEMWEVRGWRLEARGQRGEGRWWWAVFFAPLLQQILLMEDGLLVKLRNSSNFLD